MRRPLLVRPCNPAAVVWSAAQPPALAVYSPTMVVTRVGAGGSGNPAASANPRQPRGAGMAPGDLDVPMAFDMGTLNLGPVSVVPMMDTTCTHAPLVDHHTACLNCAAAPNSAGPSGIAVRVEQPSDC
jgi:hypothetical protein